MAQAVLAVAGSAMERAVKERAAMEYPRWLVALLSSDIVYAQSA
jgi:hypothetical protein